MKSLISYLPVLFYLNVSAQSNFTYPALIVEYDSAVVFRNLKLIPVKRIETKEEINTTLNANSLITLKQGLQTGLVKLKERSNYMVENINVLVVENNSNKNLIIKSGELVSGGRQDRAFATDTILAPDKKQHTIPVYCIEETRWSIKEKKFFYAGYAGGGLQKIIDSAQSQTKLWGEIKRVLKTNNLTSSSSYASLLKNKRTADTINEYLKYFLDQFKNKDSSIVGIIAVTDSRVLGADVFASSSLFYQSIARLVQKFSIEAIISGGKPAPGIEKEKQYANEMLSPQTQAVFLSKKGNRFYYKNILLQITGY